VNILKNISIEELKQKAAELRQTVLTMIYEAQSGHPGGSFSAADVVTALYFKETNIDPKNPRWEDRDRFVLSKGHACPAQYAALAMLGYVPYETIHKLREYGSPFQGHPDMKKCPGIDISTGSLGQGLSCGVGMAIAGKIDEKNYRVFVMVGDGECNEGQIWEAVQTAAKYKLDNLVVFVDNNGLQLDGTTDEIMPTQDFEDKFRAFGFETQRIDGHSMEQIVSVLDFVRGQKNGKPKCIVLDTVKGKGVSFMENKCNWHGVAPNDEEYEQAMKELRASVQ